MTAFRDHLKSGATTVCRAWDITRSDGISLGFTDHDRDFSFDQVTYLAGSALDGAELETKLGLTPDNGAVSGALQSDVINEEDILNGLFDDARIQAWLVNWSNPTERETIFSGYLGLIEIADGTFSAELRSHSDRLNQPLGRRYLRKCGTELGSKPCGVDLSSPSLCAEALVEEVILPRITVSVSDGFEAGWFEEGVLQIGAQYLRITQDRPYGSDRRLTVPDLKRDQVAVGDGVKLFTGCDKTTETCRDKFANLINFQGFPFIPGEDSALATPNAGGGN